MLLNYNKGDFITKASAFMYFVYILRCSNTKLYIGCTQNITERINRHKKGLVVATRYLLPVKLISCLIVANKCKAYQLEKYLKSGSGRAFIKKHLL